MEFKKTGTINYKVFKKRDIEQLVLLFSKIKNELDDKDTDLKLIINYKDGSSVQGVDMSTFDETKLIKSINFTLRNFNLNKRIEFYISESRGEYIVESGNVDWVDAKFSQTEKILQAVPDQNKYLAKFHYQVIISNLLGIFLGIFLYSSFLASIIEEKDMNNDIASFFLIFFLIVVTQIIVGYLMNHLIFKLYPEIEFDTTLEHINKSKKIKAFFWSFITLILIPLGLNLLIK